MKMDVFQFCRQSTRYNERERVPNCDVLNVAFFNAHLRRFISIVAVMATGSMLLLSASASAQTGADLFASQCSGCHNDVAHPKALVYNAAGNVSIIEAVNALGMGAKGSLADHTSIAAYLDSVKPTITLAPVAHDSPGTAITLGDIIVSAAEEHADWKMIADIASVSAPTKGTVAYRYGQGFAKPSIVTYTPFHGQSGTDTWTYQGSGPGGTTTIRTASVSIAPAAGPATVDLNQHGLTGSWFEPATSGQGLEVEVFANASTGTGSTFVSWFTYDTIAGGAERQRWYTAQGQVVTGQPSASLTIYQNTGGNFNAPPVTNAQPVGSATLSFDTCTSGQLSYSFSDGSGRTGTMPLIRLTQNVTCSTTTPHPTNADFALSGNWFGGAATSGQGFTVELNPTSGALFAAWYTYVPSGTAAGAAGQRWYTAQGGVTPGMRSIPVTIYETSGGIFDKPTPPGQSTVPVGTGTMAFQSCSAATFSYAFTGGTSAGLSGTIALIRVGPVPPGCTL